MEFFKWQTQLCDDNHQPIGTISYHGMFRLDDYEIEGLDKDLLDSITKDTEEVKENSKIPIKWLDENKEPEVFIDKHYLRISEDDEYLFQSKCVSLFCGLI